MIKSFSLLLIASITTLHLPAQHMLYQIEWKGDSIGYMDMTKTEDGDTQHFKISSRSNVSILIDFELATDYFSVYKNGSLEKAETHNKLNDKTRSKSSIQKMRTGYKVVVDDEEWFENGTISESIATLYFHEPTDNKIFSERFGEWCKLEKTSPTTFTLYKPNGKENYYTYKDGICVKAEVVTSLTRVIIKKVR